ncbi:MULTISPECIES: LOG family protein [Helicobacter]|uniref:AMP nucleosidase n=1 Tax=Helicobacter ibis TaxID=2962633 RepID=A0ABT4VC26_9HELI|nr:MULTISPECIES: LOG family protein [Helicobacter]MDA3967029.1 LOG family protein [Helicobacter sp. WB40]MDA3968254.1 LOG family protein [Helicobacter ibis]
MEFGVGFSDEFKNASSKLDGYNNIVSVFGGTRIQSDSYIYNDIQNLCYSLALSGYSIMTGGGSGAMEAANRGLFLAKQEHNLEGISSIGLNIKLPFEQEFNSYLDIPLEFSHFAIRKQVFLDYSQAFIVVNGGFGTLDEIGEILVNIAVLKKEKVPFIFYGDYYDELYKWIETKMLKECLIGKDEFGIIKTAKTHDKVLDILKHGIIKPIHHK